MRKFRCRKTSKELDQMIKFLKIHLQKVTMGSEEKFVYSTLRIVWLITLVLLCELIVPFGVFLLPLLLLNYVVRYLCNFHPKYGKILSGMSSLAASDDLYEKPLFAVLLYYFVDDCIDIEEHRQLFLKKVVNAKNEDGTLKYPELRMHITTLLGYSVWKQDEEFKIENHIKLYDKSILKLSQGQKLDEDGLMTATNDILIKPFHRNRSPWEILVFHGAQTKLCRSKRQSLIVFRYHHALSDGYSITKLMANVTTGDYFQSPMLTAKNSRWRQLVEIALFPFTGMFVMAAYLSKYIDNNSWTYKVNFEAKKIRDMAYFCSDSIAIDKVKDIKNKLGASFNGIILAAICGGIRKHYIVKETHVPAHMHVGLSFPVPGHPAQKLTNHWTAAFIRLPIGLASSHKRLDGIQEQFKRYETKLVSQMPFIGSIYGGSLFKDLISYILKNLLKGSTCSMSIFPGPENLKFLSGERITSGGFLLGPLANQGVAITVVSYNGGLRVFFGAEKSLMPPEDSKRIVKYITQEFDNFMYKKIM